MGELSKPEQELEWRRCKGATATDWEACVYFLENYWFIRHPAHGKILFELRDAQKQTLEAWITERYTIVLKARQIGFSTLAAGLTFWETYFWEDHQEVLLSRTEREAKKLLKKIKYGYKFLPEWLKLRGPKMASETQTAIEWDNESEIESLPSQSDPARGEAVYRVFVDEWAFLLNAEDAWASIEPIADVGGRITGLSTANGSGNFFHEFWVSATTGAGPGSRFKPIFFPWSAMPERGDDWYAAKKNSMKPWQLAQEYPTTPEEAFVRSGNTVFDTDFIEQFVPDDTYKRGALVSLGQSPKNFEWRGSVDGEMRLWEEPQLGRTYVIGGDIAEGLEHGDYSVAHVLDVRTGAQCAVWHGHIDPDDFATVLARLGWWYNTALVAPEANNHGAATVRAMQRLRYPRIYRRRTMGNRQDKAMQQLGWLTTTKTKPVMIDELNTAMKNADIIIRDKHTLAELKTYVREPDGKMHGSPYDDRVTALAIGVQMFAHAFEKSEPDEVDPMWTGDWWLQQITGDTSQQSFLGANQVRRAS